MRKNIQRAVCALISTEQMSERISELLHSVIFTVPPTLYRQQAERTFWKRRAFNTPKASEIKALQLIKNDLIGLQSRFTLCLRFQLKQTAVK